MVQRKLEQQTANNWLVNYANEQFYNQVQGFINLLQSTWQKSTPPKILLAENNPHLFLALFLASVILDYPVFLANPSWNPSEWQQVKQLIQPSLVWDSTQQQFILSDVVEIPPINFPGKIMIPTGGSSGQIRFTMHNWDTLTAAIEGFSQYFAEKKINSCCLLPLYHVSGLMQCLRSLVTGGKLLILSYSDLKNHQIPSFPTQDYFLSLVPTQLQFLLASNPLWLSGFKTILLGGAPSWTEILNLAREQKIPLALTYGMTETAALIVALKPEQFLQGNHTMGKLLPHAQIHILTEQGEILDYGQTGMIGIKASSLCLGYYPHVFSQDILFLSNDLGSFNAEGYLTILGRGDRVIITGGEKVYPEEVEKIIKDTGLVADVCVIGLPHSYWGEIVVAVYVCFTPRQIDQAIAEKVLGKLSKFKLPKHWLQIDRIPRNRQGKINYLQVKQWVVTQLGVV